MESTKQADRPFHLLFANNPLPTWVYDVSTLDFLEVNTAATEHYGYSRSEFLRMRLTDLEEASTSSTVVDGHAGRPQEGTYCHRLKNGRLRDVDIDSRAVEFAGRRAALVVATDVTALKQIQTSLAESTERLTLLHEIDRALLAAEEPGAIAGAVLPRLRDLLGVPRAIVNLFDLQRGEVEWLAAIGRRRMHVGPGVRFSLSLMGDLAALQRGEVQILDVDRLSGAEAEALRGSGVHMYMVVPMIAGGELIGAISFGGERREFPKGQVAIAKEVAAQLAVALAQARLRERVTRQAAALERQAEELEERVHDRTREVTFANQQLQREITERRRAEEEAARANRAKSEFLSRMSHELRTPLNGIIGFAQLLELDPLNPEQRESADHILKGGRHLLTLINEILDIARIEADTLSISLEPVQARDVVRSALDLIRPQAAARGVKLSDAVGAERYVMADRQRLQQVLLNLFSNAVKYNREGGSVTVSCTESPGTGVHITVRDTGRGIAPEMLRRLFTPFDRLGAEQAGIEGTGLGLALSKRLVEAMNGVLLVESRLGEGTTFMVELSSADAPAASPPEPDENQSIATETAKTRGTLLYIEDNLANLRLLERIVSRRPGLTLLSAMQGSRGLELARDHRPGAIVLDLHLPDIPGSEVLAHLREDQRTRDIPVVILSADATAGQITRLLSQGARAYLTKPVDVGEILTLLDDIFTGNEGDGHA